MEAIFSRKTKEKAVGWLSFKTCSTSSFEKCVCWHACVETQQKMHLHGTNAESFDTAFVLFLP
jgi:hypothetical protein